MRERNALEVARVVLRNDLGAGDGHDRVRPSSSEATTWLFSQELCE